MNRLPTRKSPVVARRAAMEPLETRKLLSVAAPNFLAVADVTQNFGNTRRSIAYYDVAEVGTGANNVFNATPTFSIWLGYEQTSSRNFEKINAFDVNPFNGDAYILAFDSGPEGVADTTGDTQGVYDLYRLNFTTAYSDYIANSRADGVMYVPSIAPDGFDYAATYGSRPLGPTGLPSVTSSDVGVPPGRSNTDGNPATDFIWLDTVSEKIGEVARRQGGGFFNQQDLLFVSPEKLLLMENATTNPIGSGPFALDQDYSIRTIERFSLTPGQAQVRSDNQGGYNCQTTESWESFTWTDSVNTGRLVVDMDDFANTDSLSNVDGMRYVERDGSQGVWVSDRDGGGDDFSYFELDFTTRSGFKKELAVGNPPYPTGFALDDDPVADPTTNDGVVDWFDVDQNGRLIISESGFFESPQTEPKIITREITDYNQSDTSSNGRAEVLPGAWDTFPNLAPTIASPNGLIDGRFGVYNRGQNYVYYFDTGRSAANNVYVFDLDSRSLVYEEAFAANHFYQDGNSIRAFTLGDVTGNGRVTADDIDAYFAIINSSPSALVQEQYDLTGDNVLTVGNPTGVFAVAGDMDYLIRRVLGTEYGDANLDGVLDEDDQVLIDDGKALVGNGWAFGDFNGSGLVDDDDQEIFDLNLIDNPTPSRV